MSPAPRLFRILLEVSDIERATAFYAELLGDPGRRVHSGRHYFDRRGTIVGLVDVSPSNRMPKPAPEHRPWGEVSFYGNDPFGNPLCFVDEETLFTGR